MTTSIITPSNQYNFKVVLLGEGCVGKTSVALRYVEDKFNDQHISTLPSQGSFMNKKLNINGKRINLAIWDTAGQEKFHSLGPIYYRMSNGAILVYDITDESTFQKVKVWVKELRKMLGNEVCLVIAGNKIDLEKHRAVQTDTAEEYAKQVGATLFHTSAKFNRNIEEMFLDLTDRMIKHADSLEQQSIPTKNNNSRRNVVIIDDQDQNQSSKSSCCGNNSLGT